jgi:hypothetical protein
MWTYSTRENTNISRVCSSWSLVDRSGLKESQKKYKVYSERLQTMYCLLLLSQKYLEHEKTKSVLF